MNKVGQPNAPELLNQIVKYFWTYHTYPEGLTHETENDDPMLDNPGGKQAFSAKSWFCSLLELNLGLAVDQHGFTLNPLAGKNNFVVRNLSLRGKKLHIIRTGTGTCQVVRMNGCEFFDKKYFRWDEFKDGGNGNCRGT